jgi:hypothetical protein
MRSSAEYTRSAALQLGTESGHPEIAGWAHEMSSWFALTQGRYRDAIKAAVTGQELTRGSSVHVQLIAQEAKARARLGETGLGGLLERGRHVLDSLPAPERPDHHFKVDPAKLDYYAMDIHRLSRDDEQATVYAREVLARHVQQDGTADAPMRVTEARLTLATAASRDGDLEQAVGLALTALNGGRRSLPSMLMVAGELDAELQQRYPREGLTEDFREAVRTL